MKKSLSLLILVCMLTMLLPPTLSVSAKGGVVEKPRTIILTDIGHYTSEPDDAESLVRLMLYSNEMDIEGIIATPSWCAQTVDQSSVQRINAAIDAYDSVRNNLLVHASGYPTTTYLRSKVKLGTANWSMANVGAGKSNEGSNLIISAVDSPDPRPVWIQGWSGLTTLAQALWDVKNTRTQEQVDAFVSKLRVYDVDGQDDSGAWICKNFPNIYFIRSDNTYCGISREEIGDPTTVTDQWVANNIQNHGPLGAVYPTKIYHYETDSPAMLNIIRNGLSDPEEQSWGGWAGRYTKELAADPDCCDMVYINDAISQPFYAYEDALDTWRYEGGGVTYFNSNYASIARWRDGYQNDLAVRMDWSINSNYTACNHNPVAVLNGDTTKNILSIKAAPGAGLQLSAVGSSDPDGNTLTYKWFVYPEAGTYPGNVTITNADTSAATVQVPDDLNDRSIHVILEIKDNGQGFPLYAYRRAIITSNETNPAAVTTINDNTTGAYNNQFEFVGSWPYTNNLYGYYKNDSHSSSATNNYFNVRFNGTKIALFGTKAPTAGIAAVSIDGGAETYVDFYAAAEAPNSLVYTSPTLTGGQHTIKVRVTGTKNASSTGYNIIPDRADVTNVTTIINDSESGTGNSQFEYIGSWNYYPGQAICYGNDNHCSGTTNNYSLVRFEGTQIKLYGMVDPSHGIAAVSIDGGPETNVDFYSPTPAGNVLLYTSPVMTGTQHTLKIRVTGTKNGYSSNYYIVPDRVDITNSATAVNDNVTGTGNSQFEYSGNWNYYTGQTICYNNDNHCSDATDSFADIRFDGSRIKLYGMVDPGHGIAAVSIDGGPETNVDFYSATSVGNKLVYTSPALTPGSHTLRIRVTGTKNAASSGYYIVPDRVDITNNAPLPELVVNDYVSGISNNQFEYVGNWNFYYDKVCYNFDNHCSSTTNNYFNVRFSGTQIKLYGMVNPAHGIAAVSIDGGPETNIDFYSATSRGNVLLYTSPVLSNGQHTLKVRVTGTKNAASSGYYIVPDRVDIASTAAAVNDNTVGTADNQFAYSGDWSVFTDGRCYNYDNHCSSTTNSYFDVKFTGTQIKLYGLVDPAHGIAAVSIDGGPEANIDFYSATSKGNELVYTSPILTGGQHTLRVRVTGTKNANSSGYYVVPDKVDIVSQP